MSETKPNGSTLHVDDGANVKAFEPECLMCEKGFLKQGDHAEVPGVSHTYVYYCSNRETCDNRATLVVRSRRSLPQAI